MFYKPEEGHGLPHSPFTALIAPRPIAWLSTMDAQGKHNIAPYSFFNAVSGNPPMVGFTSEGLKDTARNIIDTGEFVVNLVSRQLASAMNLTSAILPAGDNEFDFAGLKPVPSQTVRPPRVAGTPAALECRLVNVQQLHTIDGVKIHNHFIIGQVTGIYIDDTCLKDGMFDVAAAGIIARLGYRGDYAHIDSSFEMIRPDSR